MRGCDNGRVTLFWVADVVVGLLSTCGSTTTACLCLPRQWLVVAFETANAPT